MAQRIRNQALLQLLSVVVQLGSRGVSSRLFVEACRERGLTINGSYFLHFDTLFDYGFLSYAKEVASSASVTKQFNLQQLMMDESWDRQFSMTHNGLDFLHRYGTV